LKWIEEVLHWMMVVEGCPQLGHSLYRGMIASLHKKPQNLKQMIKHQFLNDKTEQHIFCFHRLK
jgi:hypothetical protein